MQRFLLWLMLAFLLFPAVNAQSQQWPIAPEAVFPENIAVDYRISIYPGQNWSDELRTIALDGQVYRYPENLQRVYAVGEADENSLLIYGLQADSSEIIWRFDRENHQLSAFENLCLGDDGSSSYDSWQVIETGWTIIRREENAFLCHYASGILSPALPENYQWLIERFGNEPAPYVIVSPDKQRLLILAELGTEPQAMSSRSIEIFSYKLATQELLSLGQMQAQTSLHIENWIENQVLIQTGETCSVCYQSVYLADVTIANSIRAAFDYVNQPPTFLENPPRYVFGAANPADPIGCGYRVYDISTATLQEYELGGCRPDFGSIDGVAYYRNIPMREISECCTLAPEAVPTVAVTRYDTRTGEAEDIYHGEVEQVFWVSSDERYALLLLDNSGVIDNVPYTWESTMSNLPYQLPQIALVDLEADFILDGIAYNANLNYRIVPINDREFIKIACGAEVCNDSEYVYASFLSIDEAGEIQEEMLISRNVIGLSPDLSGILYRTNESAIHFYERQSGEDYPLVNALPSHYGFSMVTNDGFMWFNVSGDSASEAGLFGRFHFEAGRIPSVQLLIEFPTLAEDACLLFTTEGANLRLIPGGSQERFGGVEQGRMLLADGQAISSEDNQIWWRLADGGWLRSDFTLESPACAELPNVDPLENEARIPQLEVEMPLSTCTLTVLTGSNLRSGAGAEFERVGSVAETMSLNAIAQANGSDGFVWWQLEDLSWIRSDFVSETGECSTLPTIP